MAVAGVCSTRLDQTRPFAAVKPALLVVGLVESSNSYFVAPRIGVQANAGVRANSGIPVEEVCLVSPSVFRNVLSPVGVGSPGSLLSAREPAATGTVATTAATAAHATTR